MYVSQSTIEEVHRYPPLSTFRVFDSSRVTLSSGFTVESFEACCGSHVVHLLAPRAVPVWSIKELLNPFGKIRMLPPSLSEQHGMANITVLFEHSLDAIKAVESLRDKLPPGLSFTRKLSTHTYSPLGGILCDSEVELLFPASQPAAFAGYGTRHMAEEAMSLARRHNECRHIRTALHDGLPQLGLFTVRFDGLPPHWNVRSMSQFGKNQGVQLVRSQYKVKTVLESLHQTLRKYGICCPINCLNEPTREGFYRAWTTLGTPELAQRCQNQLDKQEYPSLRHRTLTVNSVLSITYRLWYKVFHAISVDIGLLNRHLCKQRGDCDIQTWVDHRDCMVRVVAREITTLNIIRDSFEQLLDGFVAQEHGTAVWDPFFGNPRGTNFLKDLQKKYIGILIEQDPSQQTISLFGPPHLRHMAEEVIVQKFNNLRTYSRRKNHLVTSPQGLQDVNAHSICPICMHHPTSPVVLDCGHAWCEACLLEYFRVSAESRRFPLKCLGGGAQCSQLIPIKLAKQTLPLEDFHKLVERAALALVDSRPSEFYHCPTPDCPPVYLWNSYDKPHQCTSCLTWICPRCHLKQHEEAYCPTLESKDDRLFRTWAEEHDVKNCPKCNATIERLAGCNHMQCTRCHTHMCWACGQTFSTGRSVYEHMNKVHANVAGQ